MIKTMNIDYEIGYYNSVEDMVKAFDDNGWQIPEGGFLEGRDYEAFQRPKCCSTCLWSGVECKAMSKYIAVKAEEKSAVACGYWTYYD